MNAQCRQILHPCFEGIPNNALYLINKTIVDDRPNNGVFLFVKEGNPKIKAVNNLLPGKGSFDGH